MKGEQCCSPNRSKNEHLCILTKQNHRAMVCKQGYHLVGEEPYLKNPKQVDKLKKTVTVTIVKVTSVFVSPTGVFVIRETT